MPRERTREDNLPSRIYAGKRDLDEIVEGSRLSHRSKDERSEERRHSKRRRSSSESPSRSSRRHDNRRRSPEAKLSKAQLKELEMPEEKQARRLAKKLAKQKKLQSRGESVESEGNNPFGDPQLHETFIWGKKLKKEGLDHLTADDIKRRNRMKQEETRDELEKVRQRRQQYERERAEREEEQQMVQREKEVAQFKMWEAQEDGFHLRQAQLRSDIRIRDGRAKPIDLLAKYISSKFEDLAVDIHEPYTYVDGLSKKDLEDLQQDIAVYQRLETEKLNLDYWRDIVTIVNEELNKIARNEAEIERRAGRQGINASVSADVAGVIKGKTLPQLVELEKQIKAKIFGRTEGVDVSYWESLQQQISAHMARVRLREKHQENMKQKLTELKKEQGIEDDRLMPPPGIPADEERPSTSKKEIPISNVVHSEEDQQYFLEFTSGRYSPSLIPFDEMDATVHLVEPEEDLRKLQMAREQVAKTGSATIVTTEDHVFEREAKKGMGDDEAQFSVETMVDQPTYIWSEKYRPRKPRYFNRVHTGFEWNKYNQTHYDLDNPPPKVVQGYKFNIFYPDLIDKSITPRYTITPCKDNTDFSTLRISAGPPYEDIAFKIVNREWEYSYKRGFRCQFHNNIFQLWFHFKRYRYRR